LRVTGTAVPVYGVSDFSYDPQTATAVWTLDRPVGADRLGLHLDAGPDGVRGSDNGLALDGEWSDGASAFPSGDGTPGGDFAFRINVLPGDATRDGVVNALDLAQIKRRLFRRPGDGVVGAAAYSPFADVTGDRVINALDLGAIKLRLNAALPAAPPAIPSAGGGLPFESSVTRDLFASVPVLD
jgi:hypothetical protein